MLTINQAITAFIKEGCRLGLISPLNQIYCTNRLLALMQLNDFQEEVSQEDDLLSLMDAMVCYAQDQRIIGRTNSEKEQMEAAIMDLITPLPSEVNERFRCLYQESPIQATDDFYQLSQANDYIKTRAIAKNIEFKVMTDYGELEITINLSKPEKDPKEIAQARQSTSNHYPKCALCMENEGYQGHLNHAARQNHRIIRFDLNGEIYGLQYSPYLYYQEHAIILNETHKPMKIDRKTFDNLLVIVDLFPHYFVGSNADLPIVGGSILAHDHYQGGRHVFAMAEAEAYQTIELKEYPTLTAEWVHWPMSVIRLRSTDKELIAEAADAILADWRGYSDPELEILAYTGDTPHNTITPIARRRGEDYELDLVLRNNRTSLDYPDGIFHPHPDVQHIKQENIGLIEAMGLAILPPRLVDELSAIKRYLKDEVPLTEVRDVHRAWAQSLQAEAGDLDPDAIEKLIQTNIGQKFARILEDAGVFKLTPVGRLGFERFIEYMNQRGELS